jgi:hypothetical protein
MEWKVMVERSQGHLGPPGGVTHVDEFVVARTGHLDGGVQYTRSALPVAIRRQLNLDHSATRVRAIDTVGP